jgi:hypothetical protein
LPDSGVVHRDAATSPSISLPLGRFVPSPYLFTNDPQKLNQFFQNNVQFGR